MVRAHIICSGVLVAIMFPVCSKGTHVTLLNKSNHDLQVTLFSKTGSVVSQVQLIRGGGAFDNKGFESEYINRMLLTIGSQHKYLVTWWGTKDGTSDTPAWIDLIFQDGPTPHALNIRSTDEFGTFALSDNAQEVPTDFWFSNLRMWSWEPSRS